MPGGFSGGGLLLCLKNTFLHKRKGRYKKMKYKTSAMKIWRAYVFALLACLCVTTVACGVALADTNTKTTAAGDDSAVAAAVQNENQIALSVDEKILSVEIPRNWRAALKLIPAPLGNLIALPECIAELIEFYI